MQRKFWLGAAVLAAVPAITLQAQPRPAAFVVPRGLPPLVWPKDNPYTPAKADLGRLLYFDKRISGDGTLACATCHDPKKGFTDQAPVSTGIRGQKGGVSAPTVINRAYGMLQFWDGRAGSLEAQAIGPMANPIEMGSTHPVVIESLRKIPGYRARFKQVFGTGDFTLDHVAMAIATFERTVLSGNAPYDKYKLGNKAAMNASQIRGMDVFFNKAKCDQCHEGASFTLNSFHNLGVGQNKANPDQGRYGVTKNPADFGAFKTPTLREIEHTFPYMHDGSLKTLEEVVDYYDKGGIPNKNLDERIKKLNLTAQDKADLVAFMKALSGTGWQQLTEPKEFPQ
ncbi:MAG: cytochrome-c peroxidase [Acidobacteria bacterium]|nr:cytochrome-c peroxidase [Acidobacteriota bacterium]